MVTQSEALPREHQDPSKWVSREDMEQAHAAQSDAEPVAWRYRYPADMVEEWSFTFDKEHADERELEAGCVVEPLYTAPPRPDASAELQELSLENNRLAFQWMERHDKIVGFISKNYPSVMLPNLPFPSPASRPDASAGLIEAVKRLSLGRPLTWRERLTAVRKWLGFAPFHAPAADRRGK